VSAPSRPSWFRRYLLPGLVFQSVVIAGGYGTGRELVEFFLSQGPVGGLLAMAVSTAVFSAVSMTSFEFARVYGVYDYRSFFRTLLGRGWVVFEAAYLLLLLIVLAVVAAASGQIGLETFGLPYAVGVVLVMGVIGALTFGGSPAIARAFSVWSFVLYGVYVVFFVWCFATFGGDIARALASGEAAPTWPVAGVRYAGYNLAVIPAVFFALKDQTTRREALVAGALTGPLAMVPALLFFLAAVGRHPGILAAAVPANTLLELLGSRAFQVAFQVMLFGTLVETGTGLLHAVNERIAHRREERGRRLGAAVRPVVAVGFLVLGALLSRFGLIDLIARGYGTLTWVFLAVFVVPVLTVGIWRIRRGAR
jgi:uncharacterized membrane protein YkvI